MNKLEIYRKELKRIKSKKPLTAENVVEEAKNKKNPLHQYFDWNNSAAGEKWRIHQARLLINYIVKPSDDEDKDKIYEYEIITQDNEKEYKHINEILLNVEWRHQVLHQAIRFLKSWQLKYERYRFKELNGIFKEIEGLSKKSNLEVNENGRKNKKRTIANVTN